MDGWRPSPRATLIALVVTLSLLALLPQRFGGFASALQSMLVSLLSPATRPLIAFTSAWNTPDSPLAPGDGDPAHLAEQLRLREAQILNLHRRVANLQSENAQLQNLRQWLGDQTHYLNADVVATQGAGRNLSVRINRGTAHGVRAGDPVIHGPYLLGRVAEADRSTSIVAPITSPDTLLEVLLVPPGVPLERIAADGLTTCLLRPGASGLLSDSRVDARLPVQSGFQAHLLEQSGLHIWPDSVQGWIVGTVTSVQPNPEDSLRLVVHVEPPLRLDRRSQVTVITSPDQPEAPATAEGGPDQ